MPKEKSNLPQDTFMENRVIPHRLYKLRVAEATRNNGFSAEFPKFVKIEHCHFHHSHNDRTGRQNKYSTSQNGHYHEVTVHWDKEQITETLIDPITGEKIKYSGPQFECGPPLMNKEVKIRNKIVRKTVPVSWKIKTEDGPEEITDDHRHFIEYLYREDITPAKMEARANKDKAIIGPHIGYSQVTQQIDKLQQLQNSQTKAGELGVE